MYMCFRGIDFASFYVFRLGLKTFPIPWYFFVFRFIVSTPNTSFVVQINNCSKSSCAFLIFAVGHVMAKTCHGAEVT